MMKKYFRAFAVLIMAAGVSAMATSCGSEDSEPAKDPTVKEVKTVTTLYVNQALRDTYQIDAVSTFGNPVEFSSTTTDIYFTGVGDVAVYAMELEETGYSLPFSSMMRVSFTLMDGYTLPEKSDFAIATNAKAYITYTDGTVKTLGSDGMNLYSKGVMSSGIDRYTSHLNSYFGCIAVTVEKSGMTLENGSSAE